METIGARELSEWRAFERIEPFGPHVDDYRAGLPAAVARNLNRAKPTDPVVRPLDFFPWHGVAEKARPEETPEQIARNVKAAVFGIVEGKD